MEKLCKLDGCEKPAPYGRLCPMHAARLYRNGNALKLKGPRPPTPPGDYASMVRRFWAKVEKLGERDCWLWKPKGSRYGTFHVGPHFPGRRMRAAHQVSYMINIGPITPGLHVLHSCDNGLCVNPAHLHLGTHLQNMREREERQRRIPARGERSGNARLTDAKVLEMRDIRRSGVSYAELGKIFGVKWNTAHAACTGRNWKHLPGAIPTSCSCLEPGEAKQ